MEVKKKVPSNTITRDIKYLAEPTGNIYETREQIEISKYYEKLPKPDLIAISEFEDGELYYRMAGSGNEDEMQARPVKDNVSDAE